jgi:hypothetical protein
VRPGPIFGAGAGENLAGGAPLRRRGAGVESGRRYRALGDWPTTSGGQADMPTLRDKDGRLSAMSAMIVAC